MVGSAPTGVQRHATRPALAVAVIRPPWGIVRMARPLIVRMARPLRVYPAPPAGTGVNVYVVIKVEPV